MLFSQSRETTPLPLATPLLVPSFETLADANIVAIHVVLLIFLKKLVLGVPRFQLYFPNGKPKK